MHVNGLSSKRLWLALLSTTLAGHGLHAAPSLFQNGQWQVGLGVGWGETHRISLSSSPAFGDFDGGIEAEPSVFPGAVGSHEEIANRQYDNGFVGLSHINGSPVTTEENPLTTFWGYDSPDQLSEGDLVFTAVGSTFSTLGDEYRNTRALHQRGDHETNAFPVLELSRIWRSESGRHDLGLTFGVSWFSASESIPMQETLAYSREIIHSRVHVEDRYDLGGVLPPVAPYEGPAAPPGPLIDNLPSERIVSEIPVSIEQRDFRAQSGMNARLKSQRFTLGGSWSLFDKHATAARSKGPEGVGFTFDFVALMLDAGVVLNRIDLTLEERSQVFEISGDEALRDGYYEEHASRAREISVRFGGYASLGAKFALNRQQSRFLLLRLRREEAKSVSVGSPTGRAHLELGGWSVMTNLDFRF